MVKDDKKKAPAQKKRKNEGASSPVGTKRHATESSERTRSGVPTPRSHGAPGLAAEEVDLAAAKKLAMCSASSEPDVAVTAVRTATPSYPSGVAPTLEDFEYVYRSVRHLLQSSVKVNTRADTKIKNLATDKAELSKELSSASVREEALKRELDEVKSKLVAAEEKAAKSEEALEAARAREEGLAAEQGEFALALAERVIYSEGFSALVSALTGPSKRREVAKVLDRVAADFPTLDKGKYGYKPITDDEMLRIYFRQLQKKASPFPLVGYVADQRTPLSAAEVRDCQYDRDLEFEKLCVPFREELARQPLSPDLPSDEDEEEEDLEDVGTGHADGDAREDAAETGVLNTEAVPSGGVS